MTFHEFAFTGCSSLCRRTPRPSAALAAVLFAAGCAPASTTVRGGSPNDQLPRSYVAATRAKSECATERARTVAWTVADTVGLQRPLVRRLVIMPLPAPTAMSVTIDVRVSEDGNVMPDSIWLTGISDRAYEGRVRSTVRGYTFWPAVLDGCAVSARTSIRASVGPNQR